MPGRPNQNTSHGIAVFASLSRVTIQNFTITGFTTPATPPGPAAASSST